jgi:integrase
MREIKPIDNNGGILFRFSVQGKRLAFTPIPGGKFDNSDDLKAAQAIAAQIEGDLRTGNFDPTLAKYGPTASIQKGIDAANQALKELREKQAGHDLKDLWERYKAFKIPMIAPTTLKIDFGRRMKFLENLPTTQLSEAASIRNWIIANKPPAQARKILIQINACCDWALISGLIEVNPFAKMAQQIKVMSDEDSEVNPFSLAERDLIIEAFERDFPFYAPLVKFCFFTGCRPSEAIALEWPDLRGKRLTFHSTFSDGEHGAKLKTQKKRTITLNDRAIAALPEKTNNLIFPSPKGKFLDWHNFANRAWRKVLEGLPEIEYRHPKQMRHTFITERILAGDSPVNVGKYVGNSTTTIFRRYLGSDRAYVPD